MTEENSNVPVPQGEVETVGVRHGMFGVRGTSDTSGYARNRAVPPRV